MKEKRSEKGRKMIGIRRILKVPMKKVRLKISIVTDILQRSSSRTSIDVILFSLETMNGMI